MSKVLSTRPVAPSPFPTHEVVGLSVLQRCEQTDQPITMKMVEPTYRTSMSHPVMQAHPGSKWRGIMVDADSSPSLIDEVVSLDAQKRHELATALRQVSETFGEVRDGKATSHVLGVLAYMLDTG